MFNSTYRAAWQALQSHRAQVGELDMGALLQDERHVSQFVLRAGGWYLDFSRNQMTQETWRLLLNWATAAELPAAIAALFVGETVNVSESRAALHTALRDASDSAIWVDGENIKPGIQQCQRKLLALAEMIRARQFIASGEKPIESVVVLGIGGSHLGPAMVKEALAAYSDTDLRIHFVSSVDGTALSQVLAALEPATTLFILSSKSFTTSETQFNVQRAIAWLAAHCSSEQALSRHFIAVTAKPEKALAMGIPESHILPLWDWVGGRFSVWSAVGLPIAIAFGGEVFLSLLAGASEMDQHFRNAPLAENAPVLMGLLACWYRNFCAYESQAIVSYDAGMSLFASFQQQLHMESLGKRVDINGEILEQHSGGIIWGGTGPDGQHAYHQLLHQGNTTIPVDFILPIKAPQASQAARQQLIANCLAQAMTLSFGTRDDSLPSCQQLPGNRPCNLLVCDELTPQRLGALIALYEHKVYVQSVLWRINAFDQWGVELGKRHASTLLSWFEQAEPEQLEDTATQALLTYIQQVLATK